MNIQGTLLVPYYEHPRVRPAAWLVTGTGAHPWGALPYGLEPAPPSAGGWPGRLPVQPLSDKWGRAAVRGRRRPCRAPDP